MSQFHRGLLSGMLRCVEGREEYDHSDNQILQHITTEKEQEGRLIPWQDMSGSLSKKTYGVETRK